MKNIFSILLATSFLCATSCHNEELLLNPSETQDETLPIDILSFDSIESFQQIMHGLESNTIQRGSIAPRASLLSKSSSIAHREDPVLRYDMRNFQATKGSEEESIYDIVGYDELVPDENLASLLNARGEIEIAGTIYKISEQGTYCFDASLEEEFHENYAILEETEGELVDTLTYVLADGIIRYATFATEDYESYFAEDYFEEPDEEMEEEIIEEDTEAGTKSPTIVSHLQNLDYSKYPRYCSDAKTVLGKFFQSLFGRNKSFDYNFTNKKRFNAKFFYYDYIFWSSIGVTTKVQKKSFLFWKEAKAEEIYSGWGDIITETELKGNILEYPSKAKAITVKNKETSKLTGKAEDVAYIFGLTITDQDLQKAIGKGLKSLLTSIKSKTGADVSGMDKLFLAGPTKYYTIYPAGGDKRVNTHKFNKVFYKDFSIGVTFDALNLSNDWAAWAASILKTTFELPNTKLYSGEVRTAVKYGGQTGAMSIYIVKSN